MNITRRVALLICMVCLLLVAVGCPSYGATIYYRITDLGKLPESWTPPENLGYAMLGADNLNELIPPSAPWILRAVVEVFPTGHIIGWGQANDEWRFYGLTKLVEGDGNADGRIDGEDLAIWQASYDPLGSNPNTFFGADWNGDGKVNGKDLGIWQANYSPLDPGPFPYPGSLVHMPEPLTLLGLSMGLGVLGFARRRRRG